MYKDSNNQLRESIEGPLGVSALSNSEIIDQVLDTKVLQYENNGYISTRYLTSIQGTYAPFTTS